MPLATDARFLEWAKGALKGLDESGTMIGVWSKTEESKPYRLEFALQIGHCLMEGKPLILIAPHDTPIPEKLLAAASAVEYFSPTVGEASIQHAVKAALARVGIVAKH